MIFAAVVVLSIGAASGASVTAPSSLDEVKQLDAALNDLLAGGPKLKALLLSEKELRAALKSTGMTAADVEAAMPKALAEQAAPPDQQKTFEAVDAVVEPSWDKGDSHTVIFFDAAGKAVSLSLVGRGSHKYGLYGAPAVEAQDLAAYAAAIVDAGEAAVGIGDLIGKGTKPPALANVKHFTKKAGVWSAAAALPPPPKTSPSPPPAKHAP